MKRKILMTLLTFALFTSLVACALPNEGNSTEKEYSITYIENNKCDISLSKSKASYGDLIEIFIDDIASGYEVAKVTANDFMVEDLKFKMPAEEVVVKVYLNKINNTDVDINTYFFISVEANKYGVLELDNYLYKAGDTVEVSAKAKGSYVLDKIFVNGVAIEGKSFVMPAKDVVLSAQYKDALPETPWMMTVTPSPTYFEGRAHWYFTYGETGLEVVVKVEDRFVSLDTFTSDPGYQDNIEVILSPVSNTNGMDAGKTLHILVSCTNKVYLNSATSTTAWAGAPQMLSYFTSSVKLTSQEVDGYNGYEVRFTHS